MKFVRIAAALVLVLGILAAACAGLALHYQDQLVAAVLQELNRRSGIEITFDSSRLEFRSHLIVVLEQPRVVAQNREIATMARLRAAVSYHSIIFTHGLPLYTLVLERPALRLPFDAPKGASPGILDVQPQMVQDMREILAGLGRVGKRFELVDAGVSDQSGTPLIRRAQFVAFHKRLYPGLWRIGFDAIAAYPPLEDLHVTGTFRAGASSKMPEHVVALGRLMYWGLPLKGVPIGRFTVSGKSQGKLDVRLREDAVVEGGAEVGFKSVEVSGRDLGAPLKPGDSTFESRFSVSTGRIAFTDAVVRQSGAPVLNGQGRLDGPHSANPQVALQVGGLGFAWSSLVAQARSLRQLPPWFTVLAGHIKGGAVKVESVSLESTLAGLIGLEREALLKRLRVSGLVSGVSATLPAEMELPEIRDLGFQVRYADGIISASQGSGRIGASSLSGLSAQADVTSAPGKLRYKLDFDAKANFDGLKPAIKKGLSAAGVPEGGRIESLKGMADAAFGTAGDVQQGALSWPKRYYLRIEPRGVEAGFKGAPGPITFASGAVTIEPGLVRFEKLGTRATGGTADLAGNLRFGDSGVEASRVTVEMHQMPAEQWLGFAVAPEDVAASGRVGGVLVIRKSRGDGFLVNGKLTLGRGTVQFGFLRSPMAVQVATLTMRDHRLALSMPDARLAQEPINFDLKVADIRHPAVRIDAAAQKLDLEELKFVEMPWMPPTPKYVFKNPVTGHVTIGQAKLERLGMSKAEADFEYNAGDWRVYNVRARALAGRIELELAGRRQDDQIRIKGKMTGVDAAELFRLSPKYARSPLNGRLDLDASLEAYTGEQFFSTMAGTASIKVRHGNLNRFTLLSRLLGLVDLKSWLTARVPDPRATGVPFRSLTADFKGKDGVFTTDNLVLDGPVMDILADGDVDLAHSTIAMKIGMLPFNTVTWLISNIPVVGKNVAGGTGSLLAAYFNVSGPISDPSVTPAPITSLEELVKKTLGLPLNIIRPDTVK